MQYIESAQMSGVVNVNDVTAGFWSVWTARVLWIMALLLGVWGTTDGTIPMAVLAVSIVALVTQFAFFCAAYLKRLPTWHTWITAVIALTLVAVTWGFAPNALLPLLLLAPLVYMDVARSYGWNAALLFVLFPFASLLFYSVFRVDRGIDTRQWSFWLAVVVVGIALVRPRAEKLTKPVQTRGELLQGVLAKSTAALIDAIDREQIFSILMRGGVDLLDFGRRRPPSRALVLTFREGFNDELQVGAVHNVETAFLNTRHAAQGILSSFVQDGKTYNVDAEQPPFNTFNVLKKHRILLLPLRTGLDLYGAVLFATKDESRAADEEIQETLLALAQQASMVLHNRVLQQQVQGDRDHRIEGEGEIRHQLARDLHDGPIQKVAAISMQLEFIKVLMSREPERAVDELQRAQQVAKLAAQEMRTMLFTLRPVVLEASGLRAALEALCKRLKEQDNTNIAFSAEPIPRLDAKVEDVAFAIMQEAITNAKKYSEGQPIHVRLIQGEALIVAQVEDEGPGFNLQSVMSNYGTRASLGLLNMQERAALIGGQVKIDTAPGRGTIVSLAIPSAT